jgi:hypothetical protein
MKKIDLQYEKHMLEGRISNLYLVAQTLPDRDCPEAVQIQAMIESSTKRVLEVNDILSRAKTVIEDMNYDELIKAIVDLQIHTFASGQNLSELRHILLYGFGYKRRDRYGHDTWTIEELRDYAKDLGV